MDALTKHLNDPRLLSKMAKAAHEQELVRRKSWLDALKPGKWNLDTLKERHSTGKPT